jgi:hypothetical protein
MRKISLKVKSNIGTDLHDSSYLWLGKL